MKRLGACKRECDCQAWSCLLQRAHERQVALECRQVQWGRAACVGGPGVCPVTHELLGDAQVALLGCPVQRPPALVVRGGQVSRRARQRCNARRVSQGSGEVELRQVVKRADEADAKAKSRQVAGPVGPLRGKVEHLPLEEDTTLHAGWRLPWAGELARVRAVQSRKRCRVTTGRHDPGLLPPQLCKPVLRVLVEGGRRVEAT
mmetsp:Transcript_20050/g.61909  ORF Transcript_20050/g.61909 Transcript_20050/m.61909 type:complete len:203 (+) Transcript_20050:572-1180(+)